MKFHIILLLLILSSKATGQEYQVVENVRFFDGFEVRENVDIEIQSGTILNIEEHGISDRSDALVIDGTGKTLLPGLINSHVHIWDKSQLKQAFRAGVFAVMDMHSPDEYTAKLRRLQLEEGYASFHSAGHAATVAGGHGTQYGFEVPVISDSFSSGQFIARAKERGSDYIKVIYEPQRPTLTLTQVSEIVNAAHRVGLMVVAHISTLGDALDLLELGVDAFVHVWDDQVISVEDVEAFDTAEVFVVPTLAVHEQVKNYYSENNIENEMLALSDIQKNVSILHQNGIPILAGTDPPNLGINYGSSLYHELALLVDSGLTPVEALKSGTSNASKHFGLDSHGILKPGMAANFILVEGDPTSNIEDLENEKTIWINGTRIY